MVLGFCFCFTLAARSQNYFSLIHPFFSFLFFFHFRSSAVSIVGGGSWGGCMGRGYRDGIICIGKSFIVF